MSNPAGKLKLNNWLTTWLVFVVVIFAAMFYRSRSSSAFNVAGRRYWPPVRRRRITRRLGGITQRTMASPFKIANAIVCCTLRFKNEIYLREKNNGVSVKKTPTMTQKCQFRERPSMSNGWFQMSAKLLIAGKNVIKAKKIRTPNLLRATYGSVSPLQWIVHIFSAQAKFNTE